MDQSTYSTCFAPVPALDDTLKRQMASLYLGSYEASSEALFLDDLSRKDEVLLLQAEAELVGFTTVRVFEREWHGQRIRVVYSGDTIVERAHWGQQALAFAWIARMGALKREHPQIPLYWLLLVKGHRTFRYLPVFGKSFHPHWSADCGDLKPLADALALDLFPHDYNPATGVVEFGRSRGHLKAHLAQPTPAELDREGVPRAQSWLPARPRARVLVRGGRAQHEAAHPETLPQGCPCLLAPGTNSRLRCRAKHASLGSRPS